ncbi:MAG: PAS domain S-box protein, partial [Kiritimatiellaceae bacterium]|nr:PAS domain S-box protein [Kiritimatiellaceae bacterium]
MASKIWLSLSVLLAGYLLSVSVGYVLNRQIATLSGHAWKYDYPVTMAMEGVVKSHESMWEGYRNAVLLGDPAHSQQALKSAAIVMTDLQALEALQSGVHDHASDLAPVITMFEQLSKDAAVVYPELIVAGDYPSDELQDQVQSVAELKETFARILNDLQVLAAEEFKEQLEEIQRLSMMQARVNLTVFAVVLLISIPLVSVSIRRIILTPFQRILSAVKLDQKPDMSLLPRDEIGDLAGAFAKLYEQQMRSNEDLKESQEHLAATLRSIGDGVVSCDTEARVVGLNVVAEKLTGWTTAEAKGLPVDEVFNIVNAETHKKIENPVVRALRDGAIVGLANHTVLIDRRGQEYQISDSCAPICGAHGGILGCVLVFRDVTEEYRQQTVLRESEERFSRLAEQSRSFTWEVDAAGLYTYVHPVVEMVTGFPPDKIVGQLHFYEQFPEQERETLKQEAFAIFAAQEPFVDFISQIQAKDGEVVSILTNGFPRLNEDGQLVGYQGNSIDITQHQRTEDEKKQLQDQLTQAQKMESVGRLAGGVAHDFNNMLTVILGHVDLALIDLPEDDPLRAHLDDIQQSALRSADLTRQLLAFARKQTVTPEVLNLNEAVTSMLNMLSRLIGEDIE